MIGFTIKATSNTTYSYYNDTIWTEGDFWIADVMGTLAKMPGGGTAGNILYNGDFAQPASGVAFDWTLRSTLGANVSVQADGPDHPHALRLQFMGGRVAEIGVGQVLLLQPGPYRVHGQARLDEHRPQTLPLVHRHHGQPVRWAGDRGEAAHDRLRSATAPRRRARRATGRDARTHGTCGQAWSASTARHRRRRRCR